MPRDKELRVLVSGSREFRNWDMMRAVFEQIRQSAAALEKEVTIIHGDNPKGADAMAKSLAKDFGFDVVEFPANWTRHSKAAGPIRNKKMLDWTLPDWVEAFPLEGGSGTQNCIDQAIKMKIPVRIYGTLNE